MHFCIIFRFLQSESELHSILNGFIGIGTSGLDVLEALSSFDESLMGFYLNMIPLIEHDNTDIGNKVIEIIHEIIHDEDGISNEDEAEIIFKISKNCIKSDILRYFNAHLRRIISLENVEDSDDNQAVYQIFEIIEDLLGIYELYENAEIEELYKSFNGSALISSLIEMFKQDPKLVKAHSMSSFKSSGDYSNRLFAAELISTIFQISSNYLKDSLEVKTFWESAINECVIIESILVSISPYRFRDPIDSDEQEYLFNLFDCLGVLLLNSMDARKSFCSEKCEGIELFIIFLKELNIARIKSIQIIDYLLANNDDSFICEQFINSGGLKVISPIFMGKGTKKLFKKYPKFVINDEPHVCAILSSLFKNVPLNSLNYFRLISKFVENSGEKCLKLIEIHEKYSKTLNEFDKQHQQSHPNKEIFLLDRINAGLFVLQQVDICLLILCNSKSILQNLIKENDQKIEFDLVELVLKESLHVYSNYFDEKLIENIKINVRNYINELEEPIMIESTLKSFL